ncbi:family 2A encapsulin nanocompartment cargo protein cysteine desulfurase [Chryseobacterium sp. OV279]|uniref:family 2A encapsulin nanocompartment cargo protein cysteine desulfurase n=1 Tax=Chryseobacterium sp. OV279 TaxID=1500285 RepID=UPI00091A3D88|nr:family 2A encapsulin nanocompartment cargo protein cysteine desulfurase [Chryseobacterium sp. OV279]SHE89726.1 cysteine desulfurase / selenocysteine lyase [Chryseobacterium sp. OV279]
MSINTLNNHSLPSEKTLEQLANQLFSSPPGIENSFPDEALPDHDFNKGTSQANFDYHDLTLKDRTSSSFSGLGASSSALERINTQKPVDSQFYLSDPVITNNKGIQPSVAGSGKSPLYSNQKNETDFNTFQTTSVNDSHFKINEAVKHRFNDINPFTEHLDLDGKQFGLFSPIEDESLVKALSDFNRFNTVQQLPVIPETALDAGKYYFLPNRISSFSDRDFSEQEKRGSKDFFANLRQFKPSLNIDLIKKDFPILRERINGKPLIWLDNAATTQKPQQVIDRISYFYEHENSNIHRAAHELAARATDAYEDAREKVRAFLNARSASEIIFVRGTTEGINMIAKSWGEQNLNAGDEIIISHLEHHANIVPWQQLAAKKGLKLKVIPVDDQGQVLLDEYAKLISPKTKLVSFTQVSNALGTVTPAKQIIDLAHAAGAKVLVDGAQSVSHMRTDVMTLDCDWFVFSGHKVFGPTGIGAVYGKEDLLNQTEPWQGGGNMIKDVTFEHTQYHETPSRFEAGTGNIADAVGLGAAIDYVNKIGIDLIHQYEHYLLVYATKLLNEIPGLTLIGTANEKASVLSFVFKGYTNDEVGQALNRQGIAVRTGHHCAQPILRRFNLESTVRPSLAFYNTCEDVDVLVESLYRLRSGY